MCGIVGILGRQPVAEQLVDALRRLEYRGYDSAGVATVEKGRLDRRRAEGKLKNLEVRLASEPLVGTAGIGHTRWATHGAPGRAQCPSAYDEARLGRPQRHHREFPRDQGRARRPQAWPFTTDTDTEVVAHLVTRALDRGLKPAEAVAETLKRIRGAFALAFIFAGEDNLMIGARQGPPLAVGYGKGEMYLGSDAIALATLTDTISYLEDGDWAILTRSGVEIRDASGNKVERAQIKSQASSLLVDKGNHRHFMAKEIYEQPEVISHTLANYLDFSEGRARKLDLPVDFSKISRLTISACGTAYYAGLVGKYWFERYARLPVEIDVASEFRYREAPVEKDGLALFISQSGETADTLAALRYCKAEGQKIAAIVNVKGSTIARESDLVLPILAGPEIGVASTKAFTCQLSVLASLALIAGRQRGTLTEAKERELVQALAEVPRHISTILRDEAQFEKISHDLSKARDILYLGRGTSYPIALEGALKLKEISYIHAEGYAAGELKHGPIALIDENVPVVVVAPEDELFEKTVSNMQEVAARGGQIVLLERCRCGQGRLQGGCGGENAQGARLRDADRLCRAGPAFGLPHGRPHGHGRRSAPES